MRLFLELAWRVYDVLIYRRKSSALNRRLGCMLALLFLLQLSNVCALAETNANSSIAVNAPNKSPEKASNENIGNARKVTPTIVDDDPNAPFEAKSIRRNGTATADANRPTGSSKSQGSSNGSTSDLGRAILSLMAVIGIALGLMWVWKMFLAKTQGSPENSSIQVLSKTSITPRQSVLLLQAGRRLIVVGTSGTELNTLCQIDNPEEVAEMIAKVRLEKASRGINGFRKIFSKAESEFSDSADDDVERPDADRTGKFVVPRNEDRRIPNSNGDSPSPDDAEDEAGEPQKTRTQQASPRSARVIEGLPLNFVRPNTVSNRPSGTSQQRPSSTDHAKDEPEYESQPDGLAAKESGRTNKRRAKNRLGAAYLAILPQLL